MRRATMWWRTALVLVASTLLLAGCGTNQVEQTQDDFSEVAVIPEDSGPLPSELRSAVPSEPTGGEDTLAGDAVSCGAPGTELEASTTVDVEITAGSVSLATDEVGAGTTRFEVTNAGEQPHELLIVLAEGPDALPRDDRGGIDESAIEEGTVIGEIGTFPAGRTCPGVFELIPGEYLLFCNVVETGEGENPSHFERGEWVQLTVTTPVAD